MLSWSNQILLNAFANKSLKLLHKIFNMKGFLNFNFWDQFNGIGSSNFWMSLTTSWIWMYPQEHLYFGCTPRKLSDLVRQKLHMSFLTQKPSSHRESITQCLDGKPYGSKGLADPNTKMRILNVGIGKFCYEA